MVTAVLPVFGLGDGHRLEAVRAKVGVNGDRDAVLASGDLAVAAEVEVGGWGELGAGTRVEDALQIVERERHLLKPLPWCSPIRAHRAAHAQKRLRV